MTSPDYTTNTIPGDAPYIVKRIIREMYYNWMVSGGDVARGFLFSARWGGWEL